MDLSQHARTLARQYGLVPYGAAESAAFDGERGLLEIVIPPRSSFVGERVFRGMVSERGDLVVAEIQRRGTVLGDEGVELAVGDVLLLRGSWEALEARADDRTFWSSTIRISSAVRRCPWGFGPGRRSQSWPGWSCCS